MSKVNTVLGPVDSSALGRTRMHEHIIIEYPGTDQDPLLEFDKEGTAQAATEQLLALKARGIATVVDATPITLGRNAEFLVSVAEASGMNIIASTGFYTRRRALPDYFAAMDAGELAAIMEHEISKGIRGTNAKAGIIKVATGVDRIVRSEERVLRAAAQVSRSTGVPIITHTDIGTLGIDQIDILESEGADLSHVVIGHSCCNGDITYYLDIIQRGAYLGFDRIGLTTFQPDEVRLVAVAGLIGAGYADRIVLSQDATVTQVGNPRFVPSPNEVKKLTYIDDEFIPRLLEGGVDPETIEQILVDNPRRIFER